MPPESFLHIALRGVVLACAAGLSMFFSGSETALFSLPPDMVSRMRKNGGTGQLVAELLDRPKRLLTTVLFGNMVVNIVFFSVSFFMLAELRDTLGAGWSTLLGIASLMFVIIFCELLPKNIAVLYAQPFSRLAAYPLLVFERLSTPAIYVLEKVTDALARLVGAEKERGDSIGTEELQMLIELSEREGVVEEDVGEMIGEVIELGEIALREVMVPRVKMVCFDVEDAPGELETLFRDHKHTLLPVYEGQMDNMLGAIHAKDFFFRDPSQSLQELISPLPFLPESATAEDALGRMREEHTRMAFVIDEYGAVEGIVALEDVLEEIVGEIRDEYDRDDSPPVEKIGEGEYRVRGDLSVREWHEAFGLDFEELSVDTVGGLIMTLLERIPHAGDRVSYKNLEFEVERMYGRRVRTAIISLSHDEGPEGGAQW